MAVVGSPDGRVVATTAGDSGLVQIRALPAGISSDRSPALPTSVDPPRSPRTAPSWRSRHTRAWTCGTSGPVSSSVPSTATPAQSRPGPGRRTGNRLYTAGLDRQVIAWDLAGEASLVRTATLDDPADVGSVWVVGDTVVAGTSDGRLLFVRRGDGTVTRPEGTAGSDWVATVRSGGSGTLLVAEDVDGTVSVWDAPSGRKLGDISLPPMDGPVDGQTWVAADGVTAATLRAPDGPLYLIDLPTRAVRPLALTLPEGAQPFGVIGWTGDGHVLVEDGNPDVGILGVLVIDPVTGDARPIALAGSPYEIATDPDGAWIAFAGQDGNLRFASLADGHLLAPPQIAVDGQVYNVSVSPDGKYVVTSGAPGQVRLWDTATFREVGPAFPSPVGAATARARFAPDGSLVVMYSPGLPSLGLDEPVARTSGGDLGHGAVIWTYPIGREAWEAQACSRVGRTLTQDEWNTFLPGVAYDPVCD